MSYTVLIVDDSPVIRAMIRKALGIAVVEMAACFEAADGKEAWDILTHHWIDVLFLDLNMPVMNGFELVELMKADPVLARTPVIVISAEHNQAHIDFLQRLGIYAYLKKPFRPESFCETIHELLTIVTPSSKMQIPLSKPQF